MSKPSAPEPKASRRIAKRINAQQEAAIKLFTEHLLKGKPFTVKDILLKAGYAETTALQSEKVMGPIRLKLSEVVGKMEAHRERILERMEVAVQTADYGDLVRGLDVTTKNIQLLTGGATHNIALRADVRHRIDALLEDETDEGEN